ncbi:MAG: phenylpyruvate tautomerase MIF-related protein [Verrucomicrobiia bacterium]
MPYVKIETNVAVAEETEDLLFAELTSVISEVTSKSAEWIMLSLQAGMAFRFRESREPTAAISVEALGLKSEQPAALILAATNVVSSHLGVSPKRVFVRISSPPPTHFGWNGEPFA